MIVNMPSNDDSTFGDLPRRKDTKVVKFFFFFQIKKFQKLFISITRQPISKFTIECIIMKIHGKFFGKSWNIFVHFTKEQKN